MIQSEPISLCIADSNRLTRLGMSALFGSETDIRIDGEASHSAGLLELLKTIKPDVLLIDFTASGFALETIPLAINLQPSMGVVAITPDREGNTLINALQAGVMSYVKKDCDLDEIVGAVRETAKGDKFFCGSILETIQQVEIDPNSVEFENFSCQPVQISLREQEIIALIAEGLTNTQIADRLFLSPHTVNTHRKNIMQKLGVNNTAAVVMYAVKYNLVNVNKFLFASR